MKKKTLILLGTFIIMLAGTSVYSKTNVSEDLSEAIKLYKSGDYAQCYINLKEIVEKDSSNAIAYYYLAMSSVQVGKKDEAVENYDKALALATPNSNLAKYANKGKTCIETPESCNIDEAEQLSPEDYFIQKGQYYTDEVRSNYEKLKIENMMREINRYDNVDPQKFEEYRDFSSMNNDSAPTNDEIAAAMKTLQRAGLGSMFNNTTGQADLFGSGLDANNLLGAMGNNKQMNAQLIQMFLNSGMGF